MTWNNLDKRVTVKTSKNTDRIEELIEKKEVNPHIKKII